MITDIGNCVTDESVLGLVPFCHSDDPPETKPVLYKSMFQDPNLLRVVFWNVNKKDLTTFVCSLANSTMADVVVLNENLVTSNKTLQALRRLVSADFYIPNYISERRFHCFCRNRDVDLSEVHSGFRTSVRKFRIGSHNALLALVHGVDVRNYDAETRQSFAQDVASDLRRVKDDSKTNKLVLLGDFNMNPYDRIMNLAAGFNAMMTRSCAAAGFRRHLDKKYEFYYNPMWSLFGDNSTGPAGTIYDTSNQGPYGWSIFDQVLVNQSIVDLLENVEIMTKAGAISLTDQRGRPDVERASNHFPLLVTFRGEKNE